MTNYVYNGPVMAIEIKADDTATPPVASKVCVLVSGNAVALPAGVAAVQRMVARNLLTVGVA